jgi:hypothetical protein
VSLSPFLYVLFFDWYTGWRIPCGCGVHVWLTVCSTHTDRLLSIISDIVNLTGSGRFPFQSSLNSLSIVDTRSRSSLRCRKPPYWCWLYVFLWLLPSFPCRSTSVWRSGSRSRTGSVPLCPRRCSSLVCTHQPLLKSPMDLHTRFVTMKRLPCHVPLPLACVWPVCLLWSCAHCPTFTVHVGRCFVPICAFLPFLSHAVCGPYVDLHLTCVLFLGAGSTRVQD